MAIDFDDLIDTETRNLLVVDSLNMAFRWRKQVSGWAPKLASTITSLAGSYNARDVVVLGDGGSTFRKGIYPEYKGNRNKDDQTEEDKQEWKDFFQEYEEALRIVAQSYVIIKCKGVEADDIAAYLTIALEEDYDHIWMISSDRDWDLLITDKVSRFSLFSKKEFTSTNWSEHYAYNMENHIDIKVLTGDSGDNIPGIAGVGPARAKAILDKWGPTAMDVLDNLPVPGSAKYIDALNGFGDKIITNYELMDLVEYCSTAIKDHKNQIDYTVRFFKGEEENLPEVYK